MEWIVILVLAAVATFIHMDGRRQGRRDEQRDTADTVQEYEEDLADAEYEKNKSMPFADMLRALRERIKRRRSVD
jgi:hypothetical protein